MVRDASLRNAPRHEEQVQSPDGRNKSIVVPGAAQRAMVRRRPGIVRNRPNESDPGSRPLCSPGRDDGARASFRKTRALPL